MGYWENLNTDNLNLKTDGEIKYVNGALQLSLIHISEPTRPY